MYSLTKCTNQVFICIIILTWDDVNNNLGPGKYICFVPTHKNTEFSFRRNQQPGDDEMATTGIIDLEARFYAEVESLVA
jgi:hypothetical protein